MAKANPAGLTAKDPDPVGAARGFPAVLRLASQIWRSPITAGAFSGLVGNSASTVLFLARSVLIARALGSEAFGLMAYALALAMFVAQFIDMRSGDHLLRFVGSALVKKEPVKALTFIHLGLLVDLSASLAAVALIVLIVLPLAGGHPQHATLQPLIRIYVLAVPFRLLKSPFSSLLITLKRFSMMAIAQMVSRLVDIGAVVALLPFGIMAIAWSSVLVAVFEFVLVAVCAGVVFWRQVRVWRGAHYRQAWRELRPFAVYGSLVGSLQSLTANLDVVALGALRPPAEVGFYTLARSGASVLTMAVGAVSQALIPPLNEAWALKEMARVRRLIGRWMMINGSASLAAIVFLFIAAKWLVTLLYGEEFLPAAAVLRLLIVFIGLQAVTGWMRKLILIAGFPRLDLIAGVIGTGFFVLLLAPFVYFWGAIGLAILLILDVLVMVGMFTWLGYPRIRLWGSSD